MGCKPYGVEPDNEGCHSKAKLGSGGHPWNGWIKPCLKLTSGLSSHKGHLIPFIT